MEDEIATRSRDVDLLRETFEAGPLVVEQSHQLDAVGQEARQANEASDQQPVSGSTLVDGIVKSGPFRGD